MTVHRVSRLEPWILQHRDGSFDDLVSGGPALLIFASEECPTCALALRRLGPIVMPLRDAGVPVDTLLARGMMGDGHIDFAAFTRSVASAGYRGDVEVEIFNADLWAAPPTEVVDTMAKRYLELIQPYLAE